MNVDNPLEEPFSIKWKKSDKESKYMSLFQNLAFSANLLLEKAKKGISKRYSLRLFLPFDKRYPWTTGMQAMWSWFWKHKKSNQQHSAVYRMNESSAVDKIVPKKVRPQRVGTRRQQELVCVMAIQELEWHEIDDVEFEGNVEEIGELAAKSGTPI